MAHIIWTKEEKHKIALAAWLTRQIHPARNLTRIVRDSMEEQIVSSRHRDIRQSQSYMSWLMPLWKIFDAGLAAENQGLSTFHLDPDNPESALLPVSAARVDAAPSEKYQAIKPMVVPEVERQALAQAHTHSQSQCSAAHCMETFSLDELLAEVTVRIKDLSSPEQLRTLIRSEVNDVLNRRLPGVLAPDVPEEPRTDFEDPVSRTRLPKVCVIGLLPSQQELFRHQYANVLDLHFLDGNIGFNRLKKTVELMDWTYKTKWANIEGKLSSLDKITCTMGGLETLRNLINRQLSVVHNT